MNDYFVLQLGKARFIANKDVRDTCLCGLEVLGVGVAITRHSNGYKPYQVSVNGRQFTGLYLGRLHIYKR